MYLFNIIACTTHFSVVLRNRSGLKVTVEELFPTSEKSGVILQVIHTASKTISVSHTAAATNDQLWKMSNSLNSQSEYIDFHDLL